MANFLQRFFVEFFKQGPLLLLLLVLVPPQDRRGLALVPPILQGGQNLAVECIFPLLLFLTVSRVQELSEGDAKMGRNPRIPEIHVLQRDMWVLGHVGAFPANPRQRSRVKSSCSFKNQYPPIPPFNSSRQLRVWHLPRSAAVFVGSALFSLESRL